MCVSPFFSKAWFNYYHVFVCFLFFLKRREDDSNMNRQVEDDETRSGKQEVMQQHVLVNPIFPSQERWSLRGWKRSNFFCWVFFLYFIFVIFLKCSASSSKFLVSNSFLCKPIFLFFLCLLFSLSLFICVSEYCYYCWFPERRWIDPPPHPTWYSPLFLDKNNSDVGFYHQIWSQMTFTYSCSYCSSRTFHFLSFYYFLLFFLISCSSSAPISGDGRKERRWWSGRGWEKQKHTERKKYLPSSLWTDLSSLL